VRRKGWRRESITKIKERELGGIGSSLFLCSIKRMKKYQRRS